MARALVQPAGAAWEQEVRGRLATARNAAESLCAVAPMFGSLQTTRWVELGDLVLLRGPAAREMPAASLLGVSSAGQLIRHAGPQPSSTRRYRRVELGDLVYNPTRISSGALAHCRKPSDEGWVSPEYVVFGLISGAPFGPAHLRCFLRSHVARADIDLRLHGSVRLRLPFARLQTIQVPVPEQPDRWEHVLAAVEELEQVITA
jgi:type I restriction enzyme M protein